MTVAPTSPNASQATQPTATADIKPKVDGAQEQGVDFFRVKKYKPVPRRKEHILVTINGTSNGQLYQRKIRVLPHEDAGHIKRWLAATYGYDERILRIVFNGVILYEETMKELNVEEGDEFDVYIEQLGG